MVSELKHEGRDMDYVIAQFDARLIASALALAMLAAWYAGWSTGRQLRVRTGESPETKWDDASLALLGLLLAFTFGTSISKHDQRRMMVVADSNAIGDFYTCASVLKEPVRTKLRTLIREYTELRLSASRRRLDRAGLDALLPRFEAMQGRMTDLVTEAVSDGTPIAVSLTNTLNEVTSNHAARVAAIKDRLPASIVLLLFLSAVVSAMLVGREQGAAGRMQLPGTLSFILLVSFAVYVTLDLNQPARGLITVSQEPIERLLATMSK